MPIKDLKRCRLDRMLGGVCGGLGRYTPIPSWMWRILFILGSIFGSFLILVLYPLMWYFMPERD